MLSKQLKETLIKSYFTITNALYCSFKCSYNSYRIIYLQQSHMSLP